MDQSSRRLPAEKRCKCLDDKCYYAARVGERALFAELPSALHVLPQLTPRRARPSTPSIPVLLLGLRARRRRGFPFSPKNLFAVKAELVEGLANVAEGAMGLFLVGDRCSGVPATDEFLDGGDVDVAVVEEGFEARHVAADEGTVLVDRVAAEGGCAPGGVVGEEGEELVLGFEDGDAGGANATGEARFAVVFGVPFVHGVEDSIGLVDDDIGPFGELIEFAVGYEDGDFEDMAGVGIEAGHFHVDPDEWGERLVGRGHGASVSCGRGAVEVLASRGVRL